MPKTSTAAGRGPWVLALDLGSSSVRAQLYDADAEPLSAVSLARVAVRWRADPPGAMEADAGQLVRAALTALDRGVKAARAAGVRIDAVALDTFWHGLMGVDGAGRPLTPLYAWGDTRAAEDAAALRERVDPDAVHARTGCFVHESYPAARLVWLRRTRGDTFPRAVGWLSVGEHLGERLFGIRRTSLSMASGTGLLDVRATRWDGEMLAACGITADRLPVLSDEPMRGLRPEFARRWPELAEVPWFPALGDGACATLGSGAAEPGRIALTVGTSAAVRVLRTGAPAVPRELWLYRLDEERAPGRWTRSGRWPGGRSRMPATRWRGCGGRCASPAPTGWRPNWRRSRTRPRRRWRSSPRWLASARRSPAAARWRAWRG